MTGNNPKSINELPSNIEVEGAAEGDLEIFRRYGVDYVFCSPGSEFIPFWEFLAKFNAQGRGPRYVNARHEGVALAMAKSYAMATGRPQVVLLHVAAGLLHGAMEIRSMYMDNIPVLVMVGQNITHEREIWGGTAGSHYFPFADVGGTQRLVQPYVKWCEAPDTNLNMHYILARAFRVAMSEPKGPVLLLMSRELMFEKVRNMKMPVKIEPSTSPQADPEALKKLVKLMLRVENPLIYTRYLGRNPDSVGHLVELAEVTSTPVFETPVYTNFPTDHPLHMGCDISPYLKDADLVLVIDGSGRPPWYPPSSVLTSSKAKVIFLDIDPVQVKYPYWGYPADLLITADSGLAVPALLQYVRKMASSLGDIGGIERRFERWKDEHERLRALWREEALSTSEVTPIDPKWLCHNINEVIEENYLVIHETITHGGIINRYVERNRINPGTRFEGAGAVGHTGLGQGLSLALGVKLANPDKTVIALEGDGSFNYNPVHACLGMSQEYGLPFLTVIFDNRSYVAMKGQPRFYPEGWSVKTDIFYGVYEEPKPLYGKLAEAFGGYAETVVDPEEVKPALLRGLDEVEKGKLALCDIILKKP